MVISCYNFCWGILSELKLSVRKTFSNKAYKNGKLLAKDILYINTIITINRILINRIIILSPWGNDNF